MFLRRSAFHIRSRITCFTTVAIHQNDNFRSTSNPSDQKPEEIGLYYRITPNLKKQLFALGGFPKVFEKQAKTFGETCVMIRSPALEVINYIKSSDLSRPTVRYVLYGDNGVGKSMTLAHILHYGHENGFILVHVPWVPNWYKRPKEKAPSATHENFFDLPIDAAAWLIHFKSQNANLLETLELKCSRDYVWSKRETTAAGAPLIELIDHGIARIKFACDIVAVLLEELKEQSTQGKCKTMVGIDGFNAMFWPKTYLHGETRAHKITTNQITLTKPFLNITDYDWTNGVCVLVADKIALTDDIKPQSELPRYLLSNGGFEHLDPFVPVRIDNYSELEFKRCVEYYKNRKWMQNCNDGFDEELKFTSGMNPFDLMQRCSPL